MWLHFYRERITALALALPGTGTVLVLVVWELDYRLLYYRLQYLVIVESVNK